MKKIILRVVSYLLVAAIASGITWAVNFFDPANKLDQLQKYLETYYVDGVDLEALEDGAAAGMVAALGNRWSYYIPASEMQAYQESKDNAYVGIGVTISATDQGYEVLQLEPEGPALLSGIQLGDVLIKADGTSLAGLSVEEGKKLIQGKEGTTVEVTVLRGEEELTFTVERRTIKRQVATGKMLEDGIGYVKINNFNTSCFADTKAQIDTLVSQGATSFIFDVRYNGGGYVTEMVKLLDYLLPEGVIYQSLNYAGESTVDYSDAACLGLPMAVLVNGSSYSAAEFFAAALSEYDVAVVVGEQTSGKGYFQQTFQLADGSAVAISTGKYFTPQGVCLEGVGITPELLVAVDDKTAAEIYAGTLEYTEDPQIIAAINALKSGK